MLIASIFGLYGIVIGLMFIIGHLARMRSFGIPYLAPVSPYSSDDMRDTMVRMPWWSLKRRPEMFGLRNLTRLGESVTKTIAPEGGQTFESAERNTNQKGENGSSSQGDDNA
jgi:spore germination protein KA/spore germination protein